VECHFRGDLRQLSSLRSAWRRLHCASRVAAARLIRWSTMRCAICFGAWSNRRRTVLKSNSTDSKGDGEEYPKQIMLTITERGWLDDAVAGVVMRYRFKKSSDGWRVTRADGKKLMRPGINMTDLIKKGSTGNQRNRDRTIALRFIDHYSLLRT